MLSGSPGLNVLAPLVGELVVLLGLVAAIVYVAVGLRRPGWEAVSPLRAACLALLMATMVEPLSGDPSPYAWPTAAAIGAVMLGWLLVDLRSYLVGPPMRFDDMPASPGRILAAMFIGAGEEFFFRGYLLPACLDADLPGGAAMALFATSLLFALVHAHKGVTFALSAGFFGAAMGMMTMLTGSILPAVLVHAAWNGLVGIARLRGSRACLPDAPDVSSSPADQQGIQHA